MKKEAIKLFEERKVRTIWDDTHEKWYFSIVDVVAILTDSTNPQTYWRVLKKRLKEEGNETITNCNALKLILSPNNGVALLPKNTSSTKDSKRRTYAII